MLIIIIHVELGFCAEDLKEANEAVWVTDGKHDYGLGLERY